MRILLHAQHLSGVGHHVRALAIARTLAQGHEVHLVDGGRPVPTTGDPERLRRLPVPGLRRGAHGLEALEGSEDVTSLLRARRLALTQAASELRPDVVLVEHYPFGKWELEEEILALLAAARSANPAAIGVASARDVPRPTRHEALSLEAWAARVRARLETSFDGLLVHGDPQVTSLAEHLPGAETLRLPVVATGYVVARPPAEAAPPPDLLPPGRPYVVASGGGAGAPALLSTAVLARQRHPAAWGGHTLLAFTGLEATEASRRALRAVAGGDEVVVSPFRADFPWALRHAELSISCAGYNTCAAALAMGRRTLLVPDPTMSDQAIRAAKLAERGLVTVLDPAGLTPERLAEAVAGALAAPPPAPSLAFDGAERTCRWIETWAGQGPRERGTD